MFLFFGFKLNLNSLREKMLVCGADDIFVYFRFMLMSICFVRFVFLFLLGWGCCVLGSYFIINDLVYFIDWNIITLNGSSVIMTFLFD
jgi:hypothetical protein